MLDKERLAETIENIMREAFAQDDDCVTQYAQKMATAIDVYVRGAVIIYTSGLTAPNGAVTGVFNGNLK